MSCRSDIWGTKINGTEYGIIGLYSGTTFVDLQNPSDPIVLGKLPAHGGASSIWRDIKTYEGYAYIVSEANSHGLQVFDMSQFSSSKNSFNTKAGEKIQTLSETNHVNTFGNAHNIFINEDSATAYVVGSNRCNGGLYMLDLSDPASPTEIGCYSSRGYTHDVQVSEVEQYLLLSFLALFIISCFFSHFFLLCVRLSSVLSTMAQI